MQIGHYTLRNNLVLAPMAGVTDRPFRQLCKTAGAGTAVSEMVSSNALLWASAKTLRRIDHDGEPEPRIVQIAGAVPAHMAQAARYNVDRGAQIIDINMGCPAKKVCNLMAGSALLKDERLVADILDAVVAAVDVPVTLKIRTGWDNHHRNGLSVARIAEQAGIQALAVHGRTRACGYSGSAEYDTIAAIKAAVSIPVIANGDIRTPQQARFVLDHTKADGIMIGRAAQGRPWIFSVVGHYLRTGTVSPEPPYATIRDLMLKHLIDLYNFYGEHKGVLIARKHLSWYSKGQPGDAAYRQRVNQVQCAELQLQMTRDYFDRLAGNTLGIAA